MRVTVVVRSRRDGLRRRWLREALAEQTVAHDVVDEGTARPDGPVVVLDDHCRPDPRWLEELTAAAQRSPGAAVRGAVAPDPWDAEPAATVAADLNVLRDAGRAGGPEVSAPAAIVYASRAARREARDISRVSRRTPPPLDGMRVALLNPWYWPEVRRGSERLLHDLAVELLALGHAPELITSHPGPATRTVEDGFAVARLRRLPPRLMVRRTGRELARGGHDAAVAAYLTDALAAARWRARTGRPAVWAYMGIPERFALASARGRFAMLQAVVDGTDAVVALSSAARDAIHRWFGVEARVIAPGVDLDHFTPDGERAPVPTIAHAGDTEDPRKRVDALVAAFAAVRREHPDARLRLMEPRDPATRARLAQPGVDFSPGPARDFYRDAWVTGLASRQEAFGLVLTESLACGTPVFGRREGGVPDIVDRPEVGRLFDDEDDLARTMLETLELAGDPGTAAACRARAEAFSTRATAAAYEALLRSL